MQNALVDAFVRLLVRRYYTTLHRKMEKLLLETVVGESKDLFAIQARFLRVIDSIFVSA